MELELERELQPKDAVCVVLSYWLVRVINHLHNFYYRPFLLPRPPCPWTLAGKLQPPRGPASLPNDGAQL